MIGSIIVVLLSGWLIMRQATDGVLAGKRSAAIAEASSSLERMQQQLRDTDLRTASLYERLNQLADEAGSQGGQFHIVIQGPVSGFVSPGIVSSSVPQSLVDAVAASSEGMFVTPTTVISSDPGVADVPGLVVGSRLQAPVSGQSYPIYFIFPLSHEQQVLEVTQRALITTMALLMLLMLGIAALVSQHVVRPIRQASITAGRLADGHLDERMAVRGTDDLASLATSMNHMASELQQQIVQLEDLSRVQQQFVSDVSHELRTPLTLSLIHI